jgi:hypothetical protein
LYTIIASSKGNSAYAAPEKAVTMLRVVEASPQISPIIGVALILTIVAVTFPLVIHIKQRRGERDQNNKK